jgi:hypothetical protein
LSRTQRSPAEVSSVSLTCCSLQRPAARAPRFRLLRGHPESSRTPAERRSRSARSSCSGATRCRQFARPRARRRRRVGSSQRRLGVCNRLPRCSAARHSERPTPCYPDLCSAAREPGRTSPGRASFRRERPSRHSPDIGRALGSMAWNGRNRALRVGLMALPAQDRRSQTADHPSARPDTSARQGRQQCGDVGGVEAVVRNGVVSPRRQGMGSRQR